MLTISTCHVVHDIIHEKIVKQRVNLKFYSIITVHRIDLIYSVVLCLSIVQCTIKTALYVGNIGALMCRIKKKCIVRHYRVYIIRLTNTNLHLE